MSHLKVIYKEISSSKICNLILCSLQGRFSRTSSQPWLRWSNLERQKARCVLNHLLDFFSKPTKLPQQLSQADELRECLLQEGGWQRFSHLFYFGIVNIFQNIVSSIDDDEHYGSIIAKSPVAGFVTLMVKIF